MALSLLAALQLNAQEDDLSQLRQAVQERLTSLQAEKGFPGAAVAVVLPSGQTLAWATGFSDLEKQTPMRPHDRMFSGSVGKSFVAAVALRLVEQGRIKLDDPIRTWFPEDSWVHRLPNGNQVSLRMLLNHRSGIPEYLESEVLLTKLKEVPSRTWTPIDRITAVFGSDPHSPPGKGFHYADTNYIVVGMLIERAARRSYYQELKPILALLKLEATRPSDEQELPGLVPGYSTHLSRLGLLELAETTEVANRRLAKMLVDGRYLFNPQLEWTGGGLLTTAADLARWAKALYEGQVLQPESLKEVLAHNMGSSNGYGLGVQIRHSGHWGVTYGHSGWMPGYQSNMEYFPDFKVSIAAQVNTDDPSLINPRQIVFEVMRMIAESSTVPR